MSSKPPTGLHPVQRWMQRRIERKGLRPRLAAAVIAICWIVAVIVFGVGIRLADPDSFDSVWLGIWWAIQTVTTVGYGDVVPGDTAGKVMASILMIGGLSLLAVVTATITSAFVTRAEADRREAGDDPVMRELAEISTRLDELNAQVARGERG